MNFPHLHIRSWFSFLGGGSSPEEYAVVAQRLGMKAVGLTDVNGMYGAVRLQLKCRALGIKPVHGIDLVVGNHPLTLLACNKEGYANLCRLSSLAHEQSRLHPAVEPSVLSQYTHGIICLTGGMDSALRQHLEQQRYGEAGAWLEFLQQVYRKNLYVELAHHSRPNDTLYMHRMHEFATTRNIPVVATGDVRYAVPEHYKYFDMLTCVRLGITVFDAHPERPVNDQAYMRSDAELRCLIPFEHAFDNAHRIADSCNVDLLPGAITPPAAELSPEQQRIGADAVVRQLCEKRLDSKYRPDMRARAQALLNKELSIIADLELADFFLVVREVVIEARRRGIRCWGRGSAANSIVAYLLEITGVCPLQHNLLFERFLHRGRKGTPDIDIDFDSERREEVFTWMEQRFGTQSTAMTATLITYRLRSALRDAAKTLGWPLFLIDQLTKVVPSSNASSVRKYKQDIEEVLGESPLVHVLLDVVENLHGCPRHLGLHSGGMVLSRDELHELTPVQRSANGQAMVQFDKEDIEAMGLVKLDVLGLRMLATLSEAVELAERHDNLQRDIDTLPLDDPGAFELIRSGRTVGVFQIESQGQMHLLAQHQPEDFGDLIAEVALFRPGPLQGGMVNPYVRRRRGLEPIEHMHPHLEPVLRDTCGVILFQEQVLEVAHRFAGMSLQEADDFRSLMSKFRDPGEMEQMRDKFVAGAMSRGVDRNSANTVFDKVSKFVGYGFCRSHAAAFARTVYQSAWLKAYHPAPYMAAVMQHRPGFYSLMTLEEEARRFGVPVLLPDINASGVRYDVERDEQGRLAIRKPLTSVRSLSTDHARDIVLERLNGNYTSVEDLYRRVAIPIDVFEQLARSGALDSVVVDSRTALWHVGVLRNRIPQPGAGHDHNLFNLPAVADVDVPYLSELTRKERLSWDYHSHSSAREHPMGLYRRMLKDLEIRSIETCFKYQAPEPGKKDGPLMTIAGIVMLRQSPQTANGVMFITLEDETGFIQTVVMPTMRAELGKVLRSSALIVRGRLNMLENWRGLVVEHAWELKGISGGYSGFPSAAGGRDKLVVDTPQPAQR